jgi:hypothetical protein
MHFNAISYYNKVEFVMERLVGIHHGTVSSPDRAVPGPCRNQRAVPYFAGSEYAREAVLLQELGVYNTVKNHSTHCRSLSNLVAISAQGLIWG